VQYILVASIIIIPFMLIWNLCGLLSMVIEHVNTTWMYILMWLDLVFTK
jgi:hypothetical protein